MPHRLARLFMPSLAAFLAITPAFAFAAQAPSASPGYRFDRGGWTYVHLEGTPAQIGFQHGRLLAREIEDLVNVIKVETLHSTKRDWAFYRHAAQTQLWPHIDAEYRQELESIASGAQTRGVKLDVWDIVALNGSEELPEYYVPWLNKREKAANLTAAANAPEIRPEGRCSAFIATGSYTKDGKIVIAHNNWSSYAEGSRWTVIFDIEPAHGHRILMDGEPGVITSQDDFGVNDAGLMVTETTITQFEGWNPDGIPEFVRSRKALQYSGSIDDYAAIMRKGDNGGYANDWLIGDRKTGEIAYLELGLKNTPMWRKKDGYFVSSNFARDPALIKQETPEWDAKNLAASENARHVEWEKKMAAAKGQIDAELAEQFLADHEDSYTSANGADERTLCGHVDTVKAGIPEWDWAPYYPGGAVTGKVTDSDRAAKMELIAHAGHPCGESFRAAPFLAEHADYSYLKGVLKDMPAGPWTEFTAGQKP